MEEKIAMHRLHETDERGFSGWVIGPDTLDEVSTLIEGKHALFLPSAALTGIRESLLKVLSLPAGYRVVFQGDTVTSVTDVDGKERYQRPTA